MHEKMGRFPNKEGKYKEDSNGNASNSNIIAGMKIYFNRITSRMDSSRVSSFEDRSIKIIQTKNE